MTRDDLYDNDFYQFMAEAGRSSAREIVPLVLTLTGARSVVDVGCGRGAWLAVFREHGVEDVMGIDSPAGAEGLEIPESRFLSLDLERPIRIDRRFDLAVCLEVAEHLERDHADQIVVGLTDLADTILFSAAVPLQGGVGHLNEQWPQYWCRLFAERDFEVVDAIRPAVWSNDRVAMWYAQNCLMFVHKDALPRYPALKEAHAVTRSDQLALVHPSLFLFHRLGWPDAAARVPLDAFLHPTELRACAEADPVTSSEASSLEKLEAAYVLIGALERERDAIFATKTFRYSLWLRRLYGRIRAARSRRRAPR